MVRLATAYDSINVLRDLTMPMMRVVYKRPLDQVVVDLIREVEEGASALSRLAAGANTLPQTTGTEEGIMVVRPLKDSRQPPDQPEFR